MPDESTKAQSGDSPAAIEALKFEAPGTEVGGRGLKADSAQVKGAPPLVSTATAAYTAARAGGKKPWWHSQLNLMLAVFGLLVLAALLFVALAPPPEAGIVTPEQTSVAATLPDEAAPWSQSQLAEARTKSQDILAELLASKKSLEEKGVEQWAPQEFAAALDLAAEGDEAYKQQKFKSAIAQYEDALTAINALFDFLPREIARLSEAGKVALSEGKSELAKQNFQRILALDNKNVEAVAGLDRAGRLDQVLELLANAKSDEATFVESNNLNDLQSAMAKLQQASQLDSGYQPVFDGLDRVQQAITEKQFKTAMSEAYRALFANRYGRARSAFARALKIKPGDVSAKRAMQQALASDQSASIGSLLNAARGYESREEWASAVNNYQTVLQRDPNQVGAKLGNIRAGARLRLDNQLQQVLADPLALSRNDAKQRASKVLSDAQAIGSKGPRLQSQITSLESALQLTDAAIKVRFVSDSATNVTLQKVGSKPMKLGQFGRKNLSLKPGRYIATGVRLGYQDVRKEIELLPSDDIQTISIRCDQTLSASTTGAG